MPTLFVFQLTRILLGLFFIPTDASLQLVSIVIKAQVANLRQQDLSS